MWKLYTIDSYFAENPLQKHMNIHNETKNFHSLFFAAYDQSLPTRNIFLFYDPGHVHEIMENDGFKLLWKRPTALQK